MCARRSNNKRTTRRAYKTVRYSNETVSLATTLNLADKVTDKTTHHALITSTDIQGVRKAKNFTLNIACDSGEPFQWALVYVPQGFPDKSLTLDVGVETASSIFEPNQNIIMSGTTWYNCPQNKFTTRLARNLNSGDSIYILLRQLVIHPEPAQAHFYCTLNYAITL